MTYITLDLLRVLPGAFSSVKQTRRRMNNTASDFFAEKMCRVILRKPQSSNLVACKEVCGE